MLRILSVFVVLVVAATPLRSQPAPPGFAEDEALSVYLLTMGRGDLVWEKFGHNAIWVRDRVNGNDRVYNYGVFDFNSPGYWSRFVKGDWLYQLADSDIYSTVAQYEWLNRTVIAQELNLTSAQKHELQAFLEWNLLPENREYLYDYFLDNCSTRVRDALDRVLGGSLRAATAGVPTSSTFRWHSRRLIGDDPPSYVGMNLGLGPAADRPISQWEEMFLPEKVLERVRELRVPGSAGGDEPLVRSEFVIFEAAGRPADPTAPPTWTPLFLLAGLAWGALLVILGRAAGRSAGARFGFSAAAVLWTLLSGTAGVVLFALWAFTNHVFAHRNENLLQLNPLALTLVFLVPALAYGSRWARRPALLLAGFLAVLSLAGVLLQILPWFQQVNGETIALAVPVHLALLWSVYRMVGGWRSTFTHSAEQPPGPPARHRTAERLARRDRSTRP